MRRAWPVRRATATGVLPCTVTQRRRAASAVAAGEVELAVRAAQVHLDGLGREVQAAGDLPVAAPCAAISATRRSAGVSASAPAPAGGRGRPPASSSSARARSQSAVALARVGGVVRVAEDRACGAALAGGASVSAELGQARVRARAGPGSPRNAPGLLQQVDRGGRAAQPARACGRRGRARGACPNRPRSCRVGLGLGGRLGAATGQHERLGQQRLPRAARRAAREPGRAAIARVRRDPRPRAAASPWASRKRPRLPSAACSSALGAIGPSMPGRVEQLLGLVEATLLGQRHDPPRSREAAREVARRPRSPPRASSSQRARSPRW